MVLAEEKIVQARVALRDAEDALEDLFTLPDLENEIVRAKSDVEKAKLDLAKAEDALVKLNASADPDDVERAVAKIDSLEVSLENAQQDLALLDDDWDAKLDAAADVRDDALAEYQDKILSYLGAEVSLEDSLLPPQDMLAAVGERAWMPCSLAHSWITPTFLNSCSNSRRTPTPLGASK